MLVLSTRLIGRVTSYCACTLIDNDVTMGKCRRCEVLDDATLSSCCLPFVSSVLGVFVVTAFQENREISGNLTVVGEISGN